MGNAHDFSACQRRLPGSAGVAVEVVDRFNEIAPGVRIGFDPDTDRRHYHVTDVGITVVPKGEREWSDFHYF